MKSLIRFSIVSQTLMTTPGIHTWCSNQMQNQFFKMCSILSEHTQRLVRYKCLVRAMSLRWSLNVDAICTWNTFYPKVRWLSQRLHFNTHCYFAQTAISTGNLHLAVAWICHGTRNEPTVGSFLLFFELTKLWGRPTQKSENCCQSDTVVSHRGLMQLFSLSPPSALTSGLVIIL